MMANNINNSSCMFFVLTLYVLYFAQLSHYRVAGEMFKHVEFRIKEQMASGTLVGSILEKAKLVDEVSRSELSRLSFNIVNDEQFASLFSINSDNGDVHTTAMIDREAICLLRKECVFDFRVSVTSSQKFVGFVAVRIVIEDINDNYPHFKNNPINLIIPESPNVNVAYKIEGATDTDSDELNTVRKYEMRSGHDDMFKLISERQLDESWDLSLVNLKPLNREAKDRYTLYVIAKDEGNPPHSGTATVYIEITDINDNSPEFTENLYEVSVPEEAAVNAVVGQVKATDADVGANGNVSYNFSPAVSSQVRDLFSIDATTGRIRVRSDLRYEAGKTFETIVSANDAGNPPRKSQAVLYLRIVDVGNTPPRVTVNPIPYTGGNALSISEASPVRTVVAHVSVEDRDSGENGLVDCRSISPQFKVRKFQGSGGYVVEIYKKLDRELSENINVTIECEDRGSPKMSARGWFIIKLLDDNDNDPVFEKQMYRGNLTERNKRGDHVLFVKAYDRDLGENASLRYSISMESTESSFMINSVSGEITAGEEFDRETLSQFSFVVKAVDGGKRIGACSVIIDILDINDNPPFFISSLEGQIAEKLPASSEVDRLRAEDRDEGNNADVSFALAEEAYKTPEHEVPFVVMPDGTIRTTMILDKEKQNLYTFPVVVKDKGRPSLSTTGTVTVHVVDSNEHPPVFVFPSRSNNSVQLRSDKAPGSIVTILKAMDRDKGRNGRLKYYITSAGNNNLGNTFTIPNASSGELMLMKNLSTVLQSTSSNSWVIRLNVSVRDQGIPVLQDTAVLKVHVTFVNTHLHGAGKSGSAARAYEDDIKYIIIACVVGGITVILSIIIVTIILCIRRPHQRRRSTRAPVIAGVQEQGDGRHFDKQLWHSVPVDDVTPTDTEEKKLAPGTLRLNGDSHRGGDEDPKSCNGGFSPNSDLIDPYTKKHMGPEPFHGQPQLYTFKRSALRAPTDDHQSDTSGETTTSDSGRGGSEEDIQLPPLPELHEDTSRIIFKNPGAGLKSSRFVQASYPDRDGNETIAFETFSPRTLPMAGYTGDGTSRYRQNPELQTFPTNKDFQTIGHSGKAGLMDGNASSRYYQQRRHPGVEGGGGGGGGGGAFKNANYATKSPTHSLPPKTFHEYQTSSPQQRPYQGGPGFYPEDIPERLDTGGSTGGTGSLNKKSVTFHTDLTTQNLKTWDLCQKMEQHGSGKDFLSATPSKEGAYGVSQHYVSHPSPQTGYHATAKGGYAGRPRSQDDDDNTTTSGSYTINPENDFDDTLPPPFSSVA